MTENQIYPVVTDIYASSNSSNSSIKYNNIYGAGGGGTNNSRGGNTIFSGSIGNHLNNTINNNNNNNINNNLTQLTHNYPVYGGSNNHLNPFRFESNNRSRITPTSHHVISSNGSSLGAGGTSLQRQEGRLIGGGSSSSIQHYGTNGSRTSMESLRENSMLTTASISIPQRSGGAYQPRIMADFSEFGLDALDAASLSPQMLQDISLSSITGLNIPNSSNGSGPGGGSADSAGSSAGSGSNSNTNQINMNTSSGGDNPTLYEAQLTTTNSNTMWSDIGNAMITTKSEPFQLEDDYIFQIDRADLIQGPTLAELNDETLLEDLNIEDLMHTDQENYLISATHPQFHQLQSSGNILGSSLPASIHHSLHQQNLQQQQQHHQSNAQQSQQQQQLQQQQQRHLNHITLQSRNSLSLGSGAQDILYDDHNTTGSSSPYDVYQTTPTKSLNSNAAFSPGSQASSNSPLLINSITPPPHSNRSQFQQVGGNQRKTRSPALHELLKKEFTSPDRHILGQSVPGPSTSHILMSGNALSPASSGFGSASRKTVGFSPAVQSRLSSSAPTHLGLEQIWQRREPRQHLLSTGSLAEAESFSSISTASVLSPEGNDCSHDEGYSDYDSDHYEDFSSDNGSDNEDDIRNSSGSTSKGKERYFWQYNVQSKGPKGQRLVIKTQQEDPHVLHEVTDPVFSPNCSVRGIKHSGKARKGDGNDLTPNPKKLNSIGKELDKLTRTINDMTPVSELPFTVRPKSRKEKNKLASRACRLKKKAQHEANKIKLFGLEIEHRKLLNGINDVKRILAIKYQRPNENTEELNQQLEKIASSSTTLQIAGASTEFVNTILDKVKSGTPSGGLEELKNI